MLVEIRGAVWKYVPARMNRSPFFRSQVNCMTATSAVINPLRHCGIGVPIGIAIVGPVISTVISIIEKERP